MKHTPGPWGVFGAQDASSDEWRALTVAESSMPFMRVCFMPSDGTETIMANARLIAAAPDLLEALDKIESEASVEEVDPDDCREAIKQIARAAIDKALGR